jgi:predicted Zn-dependent protease
MTNLRRSLALTGLVLAVGCALNPVTGRRELSLVSEAQEIAMGREGAAAVAASIGLHPDVGLQSWVNGMGVALAAKTERPGLPWEFKIADDASVNAFALPGGFIFVTRGLLTQMTNEAELASVIGHEIGHVTARHSVQQMSREQLAMLGLGIGSAISPTIEKYGQVAGAGLGLLFLKYGRDDETESDKLGFRYAMTGGFDTREMANVFRMFQLQSAIGGGGRLPEWQSSHPDPGNRIETVQRMVTAASATDFSTLRVGEPEYLRRLDGMVYGVNPRLGFFVGSLFAHPDLAFTLRYPDGWKTNNGNDAVTAVSTAQDAVIQLRGAQGTAAQAAQAFFAQEGLTAGPQSSGTIHGLRAIRGEFTAKAEGGVDVRGTAVFIEHGGATWNVTAYTATDKYATYSPAFERSFASFARLTDAAALAVQPHHVRIVAAPRAMTLTQFNNEQPSSIPIAELAMINGMDAQASLRAGQLVKRVTGAPLPRTVNAP